MSDQLALEVNSPEWWEDYFAKHWESYGGRDQTRGFMRAMLAQLPAAERAWLTADSRSVHDWGCAFGDGVDELRVQFPLTQASGSDASTVALEQARLRYPDLEFVEAQSGFAPRNRCDAIVVSNCLEHFPDPWQVLTEISTQAQQLLWVLVPASEDPLMYCHVHRFDPGTNPARLGQFVLLDERIIQVDSLYWPSGQQLLLTYGAADYAAARIARE